MAVGKARCSGIRLARAESGDGVPVAHRDGPKGKRKPISVMAMAANLVSESDGSRKSDGSGRRSLKKLFSVRRVARSSRRSKTSAASCAEKLAQMNKEEKTLQNLLL